MNNKNFSDVFKTELPEFLNIYSKILFNKMMNHKPIKKSNIIINNLNYFQNNYHINRHNKEDFIEKQVKRYHMSFLNTPNFDKDVFTKNKYNYMYGGINDKVNTILYPIFEPFLEFINKNETIPYNQITINWFDSKDDYIPIHLDCPYKLLPNSDIKIISLGGSRIMRFYDNDRKINKNKFDITVKHGNIISLTYDQIFTHRHGILPTHDNDCKRISISFRKTQIS